jgi:hypothetical protein
LIILQSVDLSLYLTRARVRLYRSVHDRHVSLESISEADYRTELARLCHMNPLTQQARIVSLQSRPKRHRDVPPVVDVRTANHDAVRIFAAELLSFRQNA